jgi:hypothetical protein
MASRPAFAPGAGSDKLWGMTSVTVRAQALNGKFLGKAVCSTPAPTLVVMLNGQQVATGTFTTGNSGTVTPTDSGGVTQNPIVVTVTTGAYHAGTYYLEPSDNPPPDSLTTVDLPLTAESQTFDFIVTAYNSDQGLPRSETVVSLPMALNTGDVPEAGVVVPIPGLRITNASAVTNGTGTVVTASVAMMCGCMITPLTADPTEPYWPESEFTVTAEALGSTAQMTCIGNSVFTATLAAVPPNTEVLIGARQNTIPENQNTVSLTTPNVPAPAVTS